MCPFDQSDERQTIRHRIVDLRARRVGCLNHESSITGNGTRRLTGEDQAELDQVRQEIAVLERRIYALEDEGIFTPRLRDIGDHAFELWLRARGRPNLKEWDPELRAPLGISSGGTGAFTVPPGFNRDLIESARHFGVIEALADAVDTKDHGDFRTTGITDVATAAIVGEDSGYPESEDTFFAVVFGLFKYGTIGKMSEEWFTDAGTDPLALLSRRGGQAIAIASGAHFVSGDGSAKPRGVLNNTVGVTAASTTTVTASEVIDLFHEVGPGYRGEASWVLSDDALKIVRILKDDADRPVFKPSTAIGEPDTILGKPAYVDLNMPSPAAGTKPILFGDVKANYLIRRIGPATAKVLAQLYAETGQVGFRIDRRLDGDIVDTAAVRLLQQAAS